MSDAASDSSGVAVGVVGGAEEEARESSRADGSPLPPLPPQPHEQGEQGGDTDGTPTQEVVHLSPNYPSDRGN